LRAAPACFFAAHVVDGAPVRERPEPGSQRASSRVERFGTLPDEQEDVLGDVLRGAGIADDAERNAVHERRVLLVDLVEGAVFAGGEAPADIVLPVARDRREMRADVRLGCGSRQRLHRFWFVAGKSLG
jgi:hypothetical protein